MVAVFNHNNNTEELPPEQALTNLSAEFRVNGVSEMDVLLDGYLLAVYQFGRRTPNLLVCKLCLSLLVYRLRAPDFCLALRDAVY